MAEEAGEAAAAVGAGAGEREGGRGAAFESQEFNELNLLIYHL